MSARELMRTINEKNVPNQQRDIGQRLEIAERATAVRPIPSDFGPPHLVNGRLTLTSGVPITTSDVTGAGTIYFTPYLGDCITLYNSTSLSWVVRRFGEPSLSLTGLTASTLYNVYGYWGGQSLVLETSTTTTATQDGRLVKSGDPTRLYLGYIYTSGTGTTEDSNNKRLVANYYNRKWRRLKSPSNDTLTAYGTAVIRPYNNDTNVRFSFISFGDEPVRINMQAGVVSGADYHVVSVGIDSTTSFSSDVCYYVPTDNRAKLYGEYLPTAGYHYVQMLQLAAAGVSGNYRYGFIEGAVLI